MSRKNVIFAAKKNWEKENKNYAIFLFFVKAIPADEEEEKAEKTIR